MRGRLLSFIIYLRLAITSGVPAKPASWGEEESPHEVKAYQPDTPAEYGG